ncbi:predicted protein [Arabidopsis lyrata subsp. lyrata]|uniref:Predicted protein n=2 Tax=Arabidopsis lyrata subsp. lyrata TaxID=81972 RepID=D7L9I7_ARALL|nr:predicted protein [Arabidopsis lyrata subsp. lyrata]
MESPKHSLIPSFLYSSSVRSLLLDQMLNNSNPKSPSPPTMLSQKNFLIASPTEPGKGIEMYSPAFYAACTFGGILSCGLTHMTVTPLDLVKCNMQLYKGIGPLWGRQIPYTMMKFASFETIVEMIYKYAIPRPKDQCSKGLQLGVSFAGGYVAGVFCAIVSHPADNLVSFLNNARGATVGDAVKKIGLLGLFTRGLPLRIVMIGTLTGAQWGIYDAFKVFVGLPTTGGVAPAAAISPSEAKA